MVKIRSKNLFIVYMYTSLSVPIHVELRVNHVEIILITHKFWFKHVHSRTNFSLKNVEHHHFSASNCESARPNDFCSPEESQKSLFLSEMWAVRYYSILFYSWGNWTSRPITNSARDKLGP